MTSKKENSFLIKEFEIQNLFGSHSLKLSMKRGLTAFIAENGVGKTTALIALHGLLTQNLDLLRGIPAEKLTLTLSKGDAFIYPLLTSSEWQVLQEIQGIFKCTFCEAKDLLLDFLKGEREAVEIIQRFRRRKRSWELPLREIRTYLKNSVIARISEVKNTRRSLKEQQQKTLYDLNEKLEGWDVLFFPTFRCIEAGKHGGEGIDFGEILDEEEEWGNEIECKYNRELRNLTHYSLEGIKDDLKQLNSRVVRLTNSAYRDATEKLVGYVFLDKRKATCLKNNSAHPTKKIKNVLSILGLFDEEDLNSIIKNLSVSSGKTEGNDTKKELVDFFISSLFEGLGVIDNIQERLRGFCTTLNEYFDGKELYLDSRTLEVTLQSRNKRVLDWESLSSGEKQITGILGKLWSRNSYQRRSVLLPRLLQEEESRTNKNLIVLVDEPELSLGIKWQNRFLQDIMKAPNCQQLIVTTHSPSIVKNLGPNETQPVRSPRV
ncbi:hypothetical protein FAI41_01310 [Acetobacteraceae bacterium]|nr:hypothetical protein FAI41_01310 [Acetobacteraceae bacterium]